MSKGFLLASKSAKIQDIFLNLDFPSFRVKMANKYLRDCGLSFNRLKKLFIFIRSPQRSYTKRTTIKCCQLCCGLAT